jgi:hypothetical protein
LRYPTFKDHGNIGGRRRAFWQTDLLFNALTLENMAIEHSFVKCTSMGCVTPENILKHK